jgi:hypothetical protein
MTETHPINKGGRPKLPPDMRRGETFNLRLTEAERQAMTKVANEKGFVTVADYIRATFSLDHVPPRTCPHCHAPIGATDTICPSCGQSLAEE